MAPRPLMAATAAQQKQLDAQQAQIDFLARLAGVQTQVAEVRTAALRRTADANNPADPIPDPPSQGATESSDQTRTPAYRDDPSVPGMSGANAGVPAAVTDVPMTPGASLPTSPFVQLVDVSAPVAGTEGTTGAPEFGQQAGQDAITRIEPDVRALGIGEMGDQMNPEVAFPWTISPNMSNVGAPADGEMAQGSGARMAACLRLAKARISAGLEPAGDEFGLAARIEVDAAMTGTRIMTELDTLARVARAAGAGAGAGRRDLVPRRASAAPRPSVPSLVEQPMPMQVLASASRDVDELELSDLF